jgi:membrane-associated phospholipid phosphatase
MKNNNNDIYPFRFWVLRTWEAILGLLCASMYQMFTINMFKEFIRAPRPIYYALKLWSSIDSSNRGEYFGTSTRSFPSGHSGTAASGLGYLICLVLRDAYNIRDANPIMSSILGQSCTMLLFCIVIWVGATRVTDYWHFQHDVITGWTIGFLSSGFGYIISTGDNTKLISSIGLYSSLSQKELYAETFDDNDDGHIELGQ